MSIYVEKGYKDRDDYLESLSEDYNIDLETVRTLADDVLGAEEDFDGLVSALIDCANIKGLSQ